MKKCIAIFLIMIAAFCLMSCAGNVNQTTSPSPAAQETNSASPQSEIQLTVFAASSLTDVLGSVISAYADVAPTVKITVNYGSSGTLQTQIENGAPADIFFSAAQKQMDALIADGLLSDNSVIPLLKNAIVLITPVSSSLTLGSFEDLTSPSVTKIAMGDVSSVPAGQYAYEVLTNLNLWDTLTDKIVFGTNVRQVLSWVVAGDVDCGIVYKTDALSDARVKIAAAAPEGSHQTVVYPIAVVKASPQQAAAADFIHYLASDPSIHIFESYGFLAY